MCKKENYFKTKFLAFPEKPVGQEHVARLGPTLKQMPPFIQQPKLQRFCVAGLVDAVVLKVVVIDADVDKIEPSGILQFQPLRKFSSYKQSMLFQYKVDYMIMEQ